jgi:hypothetical protein
MTKVIPIGTLVRLVPEGGKDADIGILTQCAASYGYLYIVDGYEPPERWYVCRSLVTGTDVRLFANEIEEAPTDD